MTPPSGNNDDRDEGNDFTPEDEPDDADTGGLDGDSPREERDSAEHSSAGSSDPEAGSNQRAPQQANEAGARRPAEEQSPERTDYRRSDPEPPTAEPDDPEPEPLLREVGISVLAVLLVGIYIFMISGVWPPMVAVESGSMEPNMNVNDLVFVMDSDRFEPETAQGDTGVVTAREGRESGYEQFGNPGDVIVFEPNGDGDRTPIIHRAMFWVEANERWVEDADPAYLGGADSCEDISACPAPHDGFITKGDNNPAYDQTGSDGFRGGPAQVGSLDPVKPEWVVGTAEVRVPRVGWLRLRFQ